MIKKIDHIGIAVANIDAAIPKYQSLTGEAASSKETVAEQKVDTVFFPVGEVRLELLEGNAPESAISKFVAKRGPGIHHICFEVEDLDACKQLFAASGLEFIEGVPERGAGGSKVAFIHPGSSGGVLIELVEHQ